jgi:hypothetical protein
LCLCEFCVLYRRVLTSSIKSQISILVKMVGKKVDDNTSKDGVMIQREISEVGGGSSYPAHTKTNYCDWALVIKVKLKARAL